MDGHCNGGQSSGRTGVLPAAETMGVTLMEKDGRGKPESPPGPHDVGYRKLRRAPRRKIRGLVVSVTKSEAGASGFVALAPTRSRWLRWRT